MSEDPAEEEPERKAPRPREEQEQRKGVPRPLRSPWIALALAPVEQKEK